MTLNGKLCKAARALAGWNQADLAAHAQLAKQTVVDCERGARTPYPNNIAAIRRAFEAAGVRLEAEQDGSLAVRLAAPPTVDPAQGLDTVGRVPDAPRPTPDTFERLAERHGIPASARREIAALFGLTPPVRSDRERG